MRYKIAHVQKLKSKSNSIAAWATASPKAVISLLRTLAEEKTEKRRGRRRRKASKKRADDDAEEEAEEEGEGEGEEEQEPDPEPKPAKKKRRHSGGKKKAKRVPLSDEEEAAKDEDDNNNDDEKEADAEGENNDPSRDEGDRESENPPPRPKAQTKTTRRRPPDASPSKGGESRKVIAHPPAPKHIAVASGAQLDVEQKEHEEEEKRLAGERAAIMQRLAVWRMRYDKARRRQRKGRDVSVPPALVHREAEEKKVPQIKPWKVIKPEEKRYEFPINVMANKQIEPDEGPLLRRMNNSKELYQQILIRYPGLRRAQRRESQQQQPDPVPPVQHYDVDPSCYYAVVPKPGGVGSRRVLQKRKNYYYQQYPEDLATPVYKGYNSGSRFPVFPLIPPEGASSADLLMRKEYDTSTNAYDSETRDRIAAAVSQKYTMNPLPPLPIPPGTVDAAAILGRAPARPEPAATLLDLPKRARNVDEFALRDRSPMMAAAREIVGPTRSRTGNYAGGADDDTEFVPYNLGS